MELFYILGSLGAGVWLVFLVLGLLVFLAPLAIWRNTAKTNRLLSLQLRQMGIDKELIENVIKSKVSPVYDETLTPKTFSERVAEAAK